MSVPIRKTRTGVIGITAVVAVLAVALPGLNTAAHSATKRTPRAPRRTLATTRKIAPPPSNQLARARTAQPVAGFVNTGTEGQTKSQIGVSASAPGAGGAYDFSVVTQLSAEGGVPSVGAVRGVAEVVNVDDTTQRVQLSAISMTETSDQGIQAVNVPPKFAATLSTPFEVQTASTPATVTFSVEDSEEVRNLKRAVARQLTVRPDPEQTGSLSDVYGTTSKQATVTKQGAQIVVSERRTTADYQRLQVDERLDPEIVVDRTTIFDASTGQMVSSEWNDAVSVDLGVIPATPDVPASPPFRQNAETTARLTPSMAAVNVPPLSGPTATTSIEAVVSSETAAASARVGAPTLDDALADIAADPAQPANALALANRLQVDPSAVAQLRARISSGAVAGPSGQLVAAALVAVGTPEAQSALVQLIERAPADSPQRRYLAMTAGAIENEIPALRNVVDSTVKDAVRDPSRSAAQIELPSCFPPDPGCNPGGGFPTPPRTIGIPHTEDWSYQIGNSILGSRIATRNVVTGVPVGAGRHRFSAEAYFGLQTSFAWVTRNLLQTSIAARVHRDNGHRSLTTTAQVGSNFYQFNDELDCTPDREGNLFTGTLPAFSHTAYVPVGWFVLHFTAGTAASVSSPWSVSGSLCDPTGSVIASIAPSAYAQAYASGGISFLGIFGVGVELVGTIMRGSVIPTSHVGWTTENGVEVPNARVRSSLVFQAFTLKFKVWVRILFWTKRWTIASWGTPEVSRTLFNVATPLPSTTTTTASPIAAAVAPPISPAPSDTKGTRSAPLSTTIPPIATTTTIASTTRSTTTTAAPADTKPPVTTTTAAPADTKPPVTTTTAAPADTKPPLTTTTAAPSDTKPPVTSETKPPRTAPLQTDPKASASAVTAESEESR